MKKNLHPTSREVVFKDMVTGTMFKTTSTVQTNETVKFSDGVTYPLIKVETSSASHPAYTGGQTVERTSSRREQFETKFNR